MQVMEEGYWGLLEAATSVGHCDLSSSSSTCVGEISAISMKCIEPQSYASSLFHEPGFRIIMKTPIQIYRKFHLQKTENFQIKSSDIFHISAQNIDCGYSLEPPR